MLSNLKIKGAKSIRTLIDDCNQFTSMPKEDDQNLDFNFQSSISSFFIQCGLLRVCIGVLTLQQAVLSHPIGLYHSGINTSPKFLVNLYDCQVPPDNLVRELILQEGRVVLHRC